MRRFARLIEGRLFGRDFSLGFVGRRYNFGILDIEVLGDLYVCSHEMLALGFYLSFLYFGFLRCIC